VTAYDYAMLAIVGLSVAISLWRGLVREIVSLLSWLVALWVASRFGVDAAAWMPGAITSPPVRYVTAFALLFVGTVFVLELLAFLVAKLLSAIGVGFMDRLLGAIFGVARGVLIAWVLTLIGGFTTLPQRDWWRDAVLAPPLQTAVLAARPLLPMEIARRIKYA
jgi:membrane protein required for colicin V production